MYFKSLKTKIILWFSLIAMMILLLFSFSFYYYFNKTITISIQNSLSQTALYIKKQIELNHNMAEIKEDKTLKNIGFALVKNHQIIQKSHHFNLVDISQYLVSEESFFINDEGEELSAYYVIAFQQPFHGYIIVQQTDIDDTSETVLDSMLVLEPILLLLLIFALIKAIDKILVPIKNITLASQKVTIDNFSHTIPQNMQEYELQELVGSFNNMVKRLQEGVDNLDRFNSDVSHELRTPLTIIKGEIDVCLKKTREPQYYTKRMQSIREEVNVMQAIVDNLLMLTKYSKETIDKTFKKCDLDSILLQAIHPYNSTANQRGIKISIKQFEAIEYMGNASLLYAIFANLVDNAIKYSQDNMSIEISLYQKDKIYFTIQDESMGIPEKKIGKITEKFYRVDESRNKKITGFGLGLSIVKNSVELHSGRLEITSKENIGTTITVIL